MRLTLVRTHVARRILLLFLLCAVLPLTALAIYGYTYVAETLEDRARLDLRGASKSAGMTIFDRLDGLANTLEFLARHPDPQAIDHAGAPVAGGHRSGPRLRSLSFRRPDQRGQLRNDATVSFPELDSNQRRHLDAGEVTLVIREGGREPEHGLPGPSGRTQWRGALGGNRSDQDMER